MPPKLPKLIKAQEDAVAQVNQNVNAPSAPKPTSDLWRNIIDIRENGVKDNVRSSIEDWIASHTPTQQTPQYTPQEEIAEPDYTEPEAPRPETPRPTVEPVTENIEETITPVETEQKPVEEPVVRTTVQPNKANESMPEIPQTPEETFDEWTQYLDNQEQAGEQEEPFVQPNQEVPESNYVQPVTAGNMVIPPSRGNPITIQTPEQLEWERENYIGDRANLTPQEWQWFNGNGSVKTGVGGTPLQPNSRPIYTPEEVQAIQYLQEIDVPVTDDSIAQVLADFTPEELGAPINEWNSSSVLDTIMNIGVNPAVAADGTATYTSRGDEGVHVDPETGQKYYDSFWDMLQGGDAPASGTLEVTTQPQFVPPTYEDTERTVAAQYLEQNGLPVTDEAIDQLIAERLSDVERPSELGTPYRVPEGFTGILSPGAYHPYVPELSTETRSLPITQTNNSNLPTEEVITPYRSQLDVNTQQDIYDWFMNGQDQLVEPEQEESEAMKAFREASATASFKLGQPTDMNSVSNNTLATIEADKKNDEYIDSFNELLDERLAQLDQEGKSVDDLSQKELSALVDDINSELRGEGIYQTTQERELDKLIADENTKPRDEIDPIAERLFQSETQTRNDNRQIADEKQRRGEMLNQLVAMGYTPDQAIYILQNAEQYGDNSYISNKALQYALDNPNNLFTSNRELIWDAPAGDATNPNDTLAAILRGDFWIEPTIDGQPIPEGTELYEVARRGNAERNLNFYDIGEGGGFKGLNIPEEYKNFIADSTWNAVGQLDNVRINEDGKIERYENKDAVQYIEATTEEFAAAIEAFIKANPTLTAMLDAEIITPDDIINHFFKGLKIKGSGSGSGTGSGYGYGGYGYRGYGGGRGYGGWGGGSSSYYPNVQAKNQEEQRINNIMKNWTF